MAFSNKMVTYCGTIGSENLGIALKKAVDEVLGLVRQMAPEKLPEFSRKHTCITQMNVSPLNIRAKHVFEIIRIEKHEIKSDNTKQKTNKIEKIIISNKFYYPYLT